MATRSKKYLSSKVKSGTMNLPRRLAFLQDVNFIALIEREVDGKQKWHVELTSTSTKALFQSKSKALEYAEEIKVLSSENERLKNEISDQNSQIAECNLDIEALRNNNQTLLKNIDEGPADGRYQRSTKSLLNVAIERCTDFASKPVQGGLAGVNKK